MNEENKLTPEMPDSIQQQRQGTLYENSSLVYSAAEDELNTVLTTLKALPFGDEKQKASFFENVQLLQRYHVNQIFNLGVASLQKYYMKESSEFLDEVMKLFEICLSFCYAADVSKRVAFDYYVRALKFCFPSQAKQCLSTKVASVLLQLVQILQEGKLATIVRDKTEPGVNLKIKGTKDFIAELLGIFETRRDRDDGCIIEIVAQTVRFASKDVSVSKIEENVKENLKSEHVVSPFFLTNWIKLLQLENVSNSFASRLATLDALSCTVRHFPIGLPALFTIHTDFVYQSAVAKFVRILEEIMSTGSDVVLPPTDERLAIFLDHLEYFCHHPKVTVALLKLLADNSISSEVLRAVLDQFFFEEKRKFESYKQCLEWIEIKAKAVDLVSKVLSLLPDVVLPPTDAERLATFLGHLEYVCHHPKVTEALVKLLADNSISSEVLPAVLDQFFLEEKESYQQCLDWIEIKAKAVDLVSKVLSLLPDGEVVNKVLKFWKKSFSVNPDYQTLACLLSLFVQGSSGEGSCCLQERAAKTLEFLDYLDRPLLNFITSWYPFLAWFIREFPTSFYDQRRADLLRFICNVSRTAPLAANQQHAFVTGMDQFFNWACKQNCTEEMKNEIIWLVMHSIDSGSLVRNWEFSVDVIKQMTLCKQLPFSSKKAALLKLNDLAKHFKEKEPKSVLQDLVKRVTSNQSLQCKAEIIFEVADVVKCFADNDRSTETIRIPSYVTELMSLLSYSPISGDRMVKVLKKSKESGKGMLTGKRVLELVRWNCRNEGADEYFDLLYSAFVDILKEDKDLCEQFYVESKRYCHSVTSQFVWIFVVCRLLSMGLFNEENDSSSSLGIDRCLLTTFTSSLSTIVGSDVLSGQEKLLLVKKVCDIFLRCPDGLTGQMVEKALINLIPFPHWQNGNSSSGQEVPVMHLELNEIMAMLENPAIVTQLSRIPVRADMSLSTVLSTMDCHSSSRDTLTDIYLFIGSQDDVDEAFSHHLLLVLEIAIKMVNSAEDVLDILRELVCFIRDVPPELIPLITVNFGHLLENQVNEKERKRFFDEVVMKWSFSPNSDVLSYLKIPRLLWRAYTTDQTPAKRCELIDRIQGILKKTNEKVESYCQMGQNRRFVTQYANIRIISYYEMEWLVFHSSLSTDEAALAFNLSFRSFNPKLRCFTLSDVPIEDGFFAFKHPETSFDQGAGGSITNETPATEPLTAIVTPLSIAQKMIHHLQRIVGQGEDLTAIAFSLWDFVFPSVSTTTGCCTARFSSLDDLFVDVFLSMLAEAPSTEVILYWAKLDKHHFSQCSEVILKACKKTFEEDDIDKEARLNFHSKVFNTVEAIRMSTFDTSYLMLHPMLWQPASCFRLVKPQLKHLRNVLESRLPIDVTLAVLDLFQINVQAGVTVGEIVSSWSCKQQVVELIESVKLCFKEEEMSSLNPAQTQFVWQLLKAFGRICMDSCKDLLLRLKELIVLYDPEDAYSFNRLPPWREMMIAAGFPAHVIDCWCVAFLTTPLEDLSSRDVDAIVDLDVSSLQLLASASQRIKNCIFPENCFPVVQGKGVKEPQTRERLRLARLLGEFINVLKLSKPEESPKNAVIKEIVADACEELCRAHENQNRRKNDLYKIHGQKLKALFTEVFGKHRKPKDEEDFSDMETHQAGEQESRHALSVARQTSYLHENLPHVLNHTKVYEPLLVLLRRWLSGVIAKPTLASHTLQIVQLLFSVHSSEVGPALLKELHGIIQARVLSLETNQALMAQLQAAGYNQTEQGTRDLWSSPTVECAGYLSRRDSADSIRLKKKLTGVLRRLWSEWKDILFMIGISAIKVGNADVCTRDLFGLVASLEEMEEQVAAVKKTLNQILPDDLDRRVKQLIRREKRHRARIEKLYKSNKSLETSGSKKNEMKKFVAVWENRFLENVQLCSERIPGCYAPNGFHSEKPVLCAVSVDNRILTVFKEEKNGRREEIENVEVKLFETGMYVYGLHSSGDDYVTDELWAAFYKLLLEDRLVPRIVLSNESPGFDFIKEFVRPVTSHPWPWKWELHEGIVPLKEDYFDFLPINAALSPALCGLTAFVTLTRENVSSFRFKNFKDVRAFEEKETRTKQMTGKAILELQNELRLLHPDSKPIRKALAGKLASAVKQTIKRIVDEEEPTEETVKQLIDMDKLAFQQPEVHRTEESRQQYALAVLRACNKAL